MSDAQRDAGTRRRRGRWCAGTGSEIIGLIGRIRIRRGIARCFEWNSGEVVHVVVADTRSADEIVGTGRARIGQRTIKRSIRRRNGCRGLI